MTEPLELYIHIPFCLAKCSYCNFFSRAANAGKQAEYIESLITEIKKWGGQTDRPIDTLYIGGGTPTVLPPELLTRVFSAVYKSFRVLPDAEITLEANPEKDVYDVLKAAVSAGVNRVSFGMQSANESELKLLGRRHTADDVKNAVGTARSLGVGNISLDIMTGLPESSLETLEKTLSLAVSLSPEHISAYILKLEENTVLYRKKDGYVFPDDDAAAEQYLFVCDYLKRAGFTHYEISNFAKPGFEGRHNTGYWKLKDYLGIGASAHSFMGGRRFYYTPDISHFSVREDGTGGGADEYIMLSLRLSEGMNVNEYEKKYRPLHGVTRELFGKLSDSGLMIYDGDTVALTEKGMLVSNAVISQILYSEEL